MAQKKNLVSEYLAEIGRRGGKAKVPKGTAVLPEEERKKRATEAVKARWRKVAAAAAKKAAAKKAKKR
jgi:hypothetical protein